MYDPAAVLLQLTVALPDEVETFPVVPSIVQPTVYTVYLDLFPRRLLCL